MDLLSTFDLFSTFDLLFLPETHFLSETTYAPWTHSFFYLRPTILSCDLLFDLRPTFWPETHFWPETNFLTWDPLFYLTDFLSWPTFWPETHFWPEANLMTWGQFNDLRPTLICLLYASYTRKQRGVETIRHSDFITAWAHSYRTANHHNHVLLYAQND